MPTIQFSGLASGIDADSIIKALTDARRTASLPLQRKVEDNEKESQGLEELNTKLLALRDSLKGFRSVTGGSITKTATSSNTDAVGVSASSAALNSTATINVERIAKTATLSFDDRFASFDTPIAPDLSGSADMTFTMGQGDQAKNYTVSVTNETTLADVARKLNEQTAGKLQASVVNVGTASAPSYILVVNGTETGLSKGELSVQVPAALSGLGRFATTTVEQAQDALLTVSGIGQVTRSTNQISDLLPGITLQLKQASTGPVQITVGNDAEKTAASVAAMVEAFNDIVSYSNENSKIERIEEENRVTNIFGSLARTGVDNSVLNSLRQALADTRGSAELSQVKGFPDLGITTARDGTLTFNETDFLAAMGKDPNSVGEILTSFADKLANTGGVIDNYTKFQGTIESATDSNNDENTSINDRLEQIERSIERYSESLRKTFTALESKISKLNSGADSLTALLQGATRR